MGSGCGDPIVESFLRPPGNSPSRWHLTRGLLLCSPPTIHEREENVNRHLINFSRSERNPGNPVWAFHVDFDTGYAKNGGIKSDYHKFSNNFTGT